MTGVSGAGAMLYMQARFDHSDQAAALNLVRTYRSPAGRTLAEAIAAHHPGSPEPRWTAHTESACFGHERVRAEVTTPDGSQATYDFLIDINGPSIHPGSPAGQGILAELNP